MSMKIVSDLKAKALKFEAEHRIVPKAMGAAAALTVTAVPASAAEGSTDSIIDSEALISSLRTGLNAVVNNCVAIATALIPIAIGLWGLTVMVGQAKKFFTKFAGN